MALINSHTDEKGEKVFYEMQDGKFGPGYIRLSHKTPVALEEGQFENQT